MEVDETRSPGEFKPDIDDMEEDKEQQDPNEKLHLGLLSQTWSLKIPEELIEQWEKYKEPGIKLGTIRIYKQSQKMRLIVPKPPGADPDEPPLRHYKMRMLDKSVKNALVLTDKSKSPDSENRARLTVLRGALEHDFNIEAMYNRNYSARMRARREKAEPRGRVMILEKQKDFDQAGINRLNAGIVSRSASSTAFSHALGKQPPKPKGQFERMARIARNDLIDMLFKLFYKQQYWSLKDLRAKVQQPEAYLKEVLAEIGHLERSGPNNGTWRLQESYAMATPEVKEDEMEVEGSQDIKMDPYKVEYNNLEPSQNHAEFDYGEPDDEDDDEDDDEEEPAEDDDMEEVE